VIRIFVEPDNPQTSKLYETDVLQPDRTGNKEVGLGNGVRVREGLILIVALGVGVWVTDGEFDIVASGTNSKLYDIADEIRPYGMSIT
jgi:hypothetical protein